MSFTSIRHAAMAATIGVTALLPGCGDAIDNALGINGNPSWNIPMRLDGTWAGRAVPLNACLHEDTITEDMIPHFSVTIDNGEATGVLIFRDGARFDLTGETWAGAPHTGHNLVSGVVSFKGRNVGRFMIEPDRTTRRPKADIPFFDRPDTGGECAFWDIRMVRVAATKRP